MPLPLLFSANVASHPPMQNVCDAGPVEALPAEPQFPGVVPWNKALDDTLNMAVRQCRSVQVNCERWLPPISPSALRTRLGAPLLG